VRQHEEEITRIGAKLSSKGDKQLLVRGGGGEAGNTGAVAFRNDAVGTPTPLLRARAVLERTGRPTSRSGRRGRDRCLRVERGYGAGP